MTLELVLLLGLYAFIIIGTFLGPSGPIATFKQSGPRLAARVERDISVGDGYRVSNDGKGIKWIAPMGNQLNGGGPP